MFSNNLVPNTTKNIEDMFKNVRGIEMYVLIATENRTKIDYFNSFIRYFKYLTGIKLIPITISDMDSEYKLNYPEPYYSFRENARLKADCVYFDINEGKITGSHILKAHNDPFMILTNDSGLCIQELDGWPGVKTKRCYEEVGTRTAAEAIIGEIDNKLGVYRDDYGNYDNNKLHATYKSSTCVIVGNLKSRHIHPYTVVKSASHNVGISDPRIMDTNLLIETMWDITTLINRYDNRIVRYSSNPISKTNIETLMLACEPIYKSFMLSMTDAIMRISKEFEINDNCNIEESNNITIKVKEN